MRLKAAFKYSPEALECLREWLRAVLGDPACIASGADLARTLKDGVLLCRLINALVPGSVAKIYEGPIAFKQIENVSNYLRAAAALGLRKEDLFDVPDLFEARNVNMVIQHLQALAQTIAKRPGYKVLQSPLSLSLFVTRGRRRMRGKDNNAALADHNRDQ